MLGETPSPKPPSLLESREKKKKDQRKGDDDDDDVCARAEARMKGVGSTDEDVSPPPQRRL